MKLNFWKQFLSSVALTLAFGGLVNADIVFNFTNTSELDGNAAIGTTFSATDGIDTVTLTSVDVFAPEFIDDPDNPGTNILTGNTIAATTSITGGDSLGVNNPTIGNGDFETFKGSVVGTEGTDFNFGEGWVISFDTSVIIEEFNFSSIDEDGSFDVTVDGVTTPFPDGNASDDFSFPLGDGSGSIIPANTLITFTVNDVNQDASVRITSITVNAVPEPSSFALLGVLGLGAVARRRR